MNHEGLNWMGVGGGSHSYWFSNTMSSAANRATFVNAAVTAVNTYGLDGAFKPFRDNI